MARTVDLMSRKRFDGVLTGRELEIARAAGLDLAYCPLQQGWVVVAVEDEPVQVDRDEAPAALRAAEMGCEQVSSSPQVAKLSVSGIGLRSHTGVAIRMFRALAQAQIKTRQTFPHPFFWAAFQLTGRSD